MNIYGTLMNDMLCSKPIDIPLSDQKFSFSTYIFDMLVQEQAWSCNLPKSLISIKYTVLLKLLACTSNLQLKDMSPVQDRI